LLNEKKQEKLLKKERAEIPATTSGHPQLHALSLATAVNISWETVNCFPLNVIVAFGGKQFHCYDLN